MKLYNLQKFYHAIVITEERSFASASKRLCITQSALTKSIHSLETDLDVKLFQRGSLGIEPSHEGKKIFDVARGLLAQTAAFHKNIDQIIKAEAGIINFGIDPGLSRLILSPLLLEAVNNDTLRRVNIEVEGPKVLMNQLLQDSIEFYVAEVLKALPAEKKILHHEHLLDIRNSLYARPGHPLAVKNSITPEDLTNYPFITYMTSDSETFPPHEQIIDVALMEKFRVISCNDFVALKSVIPNSDAIIATLDSTVVSELESGELIQLKIKPIKNKRNISIVTRADRTLSKPAKLLIESIRKLAQ